VSGSPKGLVSETAHPLLDRIAARPQLAALAGALFIGFSGIFYRYAEVSPETATVFRSLYGLPVLGAVAWLERRRFGGMPGSSIRLAALAGIFFAADLLLWHHAIEFIGAGLATVLGNLQVVVVALVAWALLRERPARTTLLALPVVVAGVVLISGVLDGAAYGEDPLLGVGLGILTAGDEIAIGDLSVGFVEMDHSVPTVGSRWEADSRAMFYTGDTGPSGDWRRAVAGVDLMLSEAAYQERAETDYPHHLMASESGQIAREAGVGRLVLTHIPPYLDSSKSIHEAELVFDKPVALAAPGVVFDV